MKNETNGKKIYRLSPQTIDPETEGTDLPNELLPVFLKADAQISKGKPANDPPRFWHYQAMVDWLADDQLNALDPATQGITALPIDIRTHVSIDPNTGGHVDGHLYQTAGLDFSSPRREQQDDVQHQGWQDQTYGLLAHFDGEFPDTYRTIGGESRLGYIQRKDQLWPDKCPPELAHKFIGATGFRLIFLTPSIFKKGWLPDWLDKTTLKGTFHNLNLQLRAAAIPRWQAGTSWDMTKSKEGKGMRSVKRLVPAGSVYWFDILSGQSAELSEWWQT